MCARHIKRAIEEFNIKLPKRLEEKEEKKPVLQYNCQVHVYIIYLCVYNLFVNIHELSSFILMHFLQCKLGEFDICIIALKL